MTNYNLFGEAETPQIITKQQKLQRRKLDKLNGKKLGEKNYFHNTTGKNIFHTDGFLDGKNGNSSTGGFTIFKNGTLLVVDHSSSMGYSTLTSNEAELAGVCYAISTAEEGDEIITDSMNSLSWIRSGFSKARPDLNEKILKSQQIMYEKSLNLYWEPRDKNLAGNYNEFALQD